MEKRELNFYEMKDLGEKYLIRIIPFSVLSLLFFGLSLLFFVVTSLKTVGWITLALTICCFILTVVFCSISNYWFKKTHKPPQWFVEAKIKWEARHKQ